MEKARAYELWVSGFESLELGTKVGDALLNIGLDIESGYDGSRVEGGLSKW